MLFLLFIFLLSGSFAGPQPLNQKRVKEMFSFVPYRGHLGAGRAGGNNGEGGRHPGVLDENGTVVLVAML